MNAMEYPMRGKILVILLAVSINSGMSAAVTATGGAQEVPPLLHTRIENLLSVASAPPKFFLAPTSSMLKSFEVSLSAGSSYGFGRNAGFLARAAFGLGGIAEIEFSTSEVINELTGETTQFPSRSLKVGLIPEQIRSLRYVPNITAQLRTSPWGSVVKQGDYLAEANIGEYSGKTLTDINLESRFTTLYLLAGKDGAIGGIHAGFTVIDVRTREGWLWLYDAMYLTYDERRIPEMKRNIIGPFGGLLLAMNSRTQLLVEIEPVPEYTYNPETRVVSIERAWLCITGIRFFIGSWLTWDTGIRYQSNFEGIADAQINTNVNIILPLKYPE